MKRMKQVLAMLLAVAMICTTGILTTGASAAVSSREDKAKVLVALGLFKGYDNTGTNLGLNDGATREHAIIFLIRMLGEEKAAEAWTGTQPYSDIPYGNYYYPYIGYAKEKGYTNGIGNNQFGLGASATMQQMTTFALRGLGYNEAAGDFTYQNSMVFATGKGIISSSIPPASFTRGDAVDVIYGATFSKMKNRSVTLVESLRASGVVSKTQMDAANLILNGPQEESDIDEGAYTLKCMSNSIRLTSGKMELRDTTPAQIFTVTNKDGYSYIQTSDEYYLSVPNLNNATQVVAGTTPYAWLIQKVSTGVYTIRPAAKPELLVCSGEASGKNGTGMLLWPHTDDAKHGLITFTASKTVPVTGIKLDQTTATVAVGKTVQLTGIFTPSNATNKNLTWSSSSSSIAKVDANGLVTGVKNGTATITAKTADGSKTATCKVTVGNVAVTGVALDQTTARIAVKQTLQLTKTISPANATNQNVIWTSSKSSVATVSDSGLVTGLAAGTATINVRTNEGSKLASCTVTVTDALSVTGIKLEQTSLTVAVGAAAQLNGTISPTNASNQYVTWTSTDSNVAKVSNGGLVTGVKAGTATITVKTTDGGFTATCKVTVTAANAYTNKTVKLYNSTNQAVTDVRISSNLIDSWGDKLNSSSVASGGSVSILVPVAANDSKYDMKLIYSDGAEMIFKSYDFKDFTSGSALYAYIENNQPMLSTTKPTATEDTAAETKTLRDRYNKSVTRYNKLIDQLSKMSVEKGSVIDQVTKNMTGTYNAIDSDLGSGTGNYTTAQIAQHNKSLDALDSLMNELDAAIKEAPTSIVVPITFVNNTGVAIISVCFSPSNSTSWGKSVGSLAKGESGTMKLEITADALQWDLQLTDSNGTNAVFQGLNFSGNSASGITITLTMENGVVKANW